MFHFEHNLNTYVSETMLLRIKRLTITCQPVHSDSYTTYFARFLASYIFQRWSYYDLPLTFSPARIKINNSC